jgi:UDP:flavonoid glycosyltransferase YjiC (YdhE family)
MRSGRPSLIVPFGFDQFDNAERLRRMGIASALPRTRYNAARAHLKLSALLANRDREHSARRVGMEVRAERGAFDAADAIENTLDLHGAS